MLKSEEQEIRYFLFCFALLLIALSIASLVLTDEYFKNPPKNGQEFEQKRAAIQVTNGMSIAIIIFFLFFIYKLGK